MTPNSSDDREPPQDKGPVSQALEELRARLAAIVESSDDAIISKDLDGTITSWNRGAERLFQYTAEEAIGKPVTLLIPSERNDEEPDILGRVRRGERVEHYETVRQRKDGTRLDISLTVSPIRDAHGKVVGASKIARDISEGKNAARLAALDQEAIRRLLDVGSQCLRPGHSLVENLSEMLETAVWITGADKGNIQLFDADSHALKIVVQRGFAAPFLDYFASVTVDDRSACGAALENAGRVVVEDVAASEIFAGQPSRAILLDAGVRAVQSTPLVSSTGMVLGMVSTHFGEPHRPSQREFGLLDVLTRQTADYLERKRGEEQREKLLRSTQEARADAEAASRAKDEFLAMLGHELRNPLAAVRNAVAAAMLDEASRPRALAIARRQSDQLARIVDDLLDVARITRGSVPLRKERISLAEVLRRAVDAAGPLMDEHGHSLSLGLPEDRIELEADPARLQQAIGNLLANAAKYTDPGGVITVACELDADQVVIRVRDNGIGIPADMLARVFEPFVQVGRSLARSHGGLGIGLTLVQKIAVLHGGSVVAQSPGVGEGAEFVVRLPAATAAPEARATPAGAARSRSAHAARVLMVEDNPDAAESLVMILELLGHHVRVVHDGAVALEAARANLPDIMLIDIGLPGMNGYQVAEAVRQDPSLEHIVLVALTGYGQPEDKARAMAAGFDYHLVKPVDVDALDELVTRMGAAESPPAPDPDTRH